MKMNKTRLLEKISIQSGVSLDEWMDPIIDRFICVCNSIKPDNRTERTSDADHPWDCYRWRLEVSDTVCNSKAI